MNIMKDMKKGGTYVHIFENQTTVAIPRDVFFTHGREANPPRLHSNMEFVAAFRQEKNILDQHDGTNMTSKWLVNGL